MGERGPAIGQRLVALALVVCAVLAHAPAAAACGRLAGHRPPSAYGHVVVIFEENVSFSRLIGRPGSARSRRAPFLNRLARRCALATRYHAVTHPSHGNYMAASGGYALGPGVLSPGRSVFSQLQASGRRWRVYVGGMRTHCQQRRALPYFRDANAPFFYLRLRRSCRQDDVPLGTRSSGPLASDIRHRQLPALAWILPDICHNMHWAPGCGYRKQRRVSVGDAWLHRWIRTLMRSPAYRRGHMLVVVTWDEGNETAAKRDWERCTRQRRDPSCHVATIAASPYIKPRTRDRSRYSHYSLLHTVEHVLGIHRYLGHAQHSRGMRLGMGF
jgi:phospholipase C